MKAIIPNNSMELIDLNCFESRNDLVQYIILDYMYKTNEISGSWILQVIIEGEGIDISVASVGRALKELDVKGYTKSVKNKGRVITQEGIGYLLKLKSAVEQELLQRRLAKSIKTEDFYQLLDLVRARRVLEAESARLAAYRITDLKVKEILSGLEKHERIVATGNDPTNEAFDFHIKVAEASGNKFIKASIEMLIYYNTQLELLFPQLVTRESGEEYSNDHRKIAEAIIAKEPDKAETEMMLHMTKILDALKAQSERIEKK